MFIDSHCHLDLVLNENSFLEFHKNSKNTSIPHNLSDILSDKLEFLVHISLDSYKFLQHYPLFKDSHKIYFATGIYPDRISHPNYNESQYINDLKNILIEYPHIAIGEAGIDLKYEKYSSLKEQESLFHKQLELAEELNLPIIIHSRESFYEFYNILKSYPNVTAICHCFSYGITEIDLLLSRGDYISFSGLLTYKKNKMIQEAAKIIPLNKVLFETDAPYLSPSPLRGTWNISINVIYIYEYFAQLRQLSLIELSRITKENATKVFRL